MPHAPNKGMLPEVRAFGRVIMLLVLRARFGACNLFSPTLGRC
jgi:hypothetical protein